MCRILGIKNFNYYKHKEIIEDFWKLAKTGKTLKGDTPGHYDGWGISYYMEGKAKVIKSGNSIFKEKKKFFNSISNISKSSILIVHLRKSAWPGTSDKQSAHPFIINNLCFAHNGTIQDYKTLLKEIPLLKRSATEILDTEAYLLYIQKYLELGTEKAFKKATANIKINNIYSSLTCIFSDGSDMFAYREYSKHPEYYTLYHSKDGNSDIVSSEQLLNDLNWKILKKDKLLSL